VLFFSFFVVCSAHAEVSQLVASQSDHQYYHAGVFQKLGTGINQDLAGFYLRYVEWFSCSSGYATPFVDLVECPTSAYTGCTTKIRLKYGSTVCGNDQVLYLQNGVNGTTVTAGTEDYQTDPTKYYYIYQYLGYPDYNYVDLWTVGAMSGQESWTPPVHAECGSFGMACTYDYLYFKILNTSDIYHQASTVSRLTPQNGQEHLNNSMQFTGFFSNTLYDELLVNIYNRDTQRTENILTKSVGLGLGQVYVINNYLNDGNYSYTAYLADSTSSSTSEDILKTPYYFTVGTTTIFLPPYRTFDISENAVCAGIATSTWQGGVECGFKKVLAWAIYPDQQSLGDFAISWSELKHSFPFNAFFDLTDTVKNAIASTTLADATLDVPFPTGATGTISMLPVMSSTSLPNLIGSDNNTLLRNTITWLFWAGAGVLVFLTVKFI
jgi:hypothetical protein